MSAAVQLREALTSCRRVLLTGPAEPDGDSIGACLALQSALRIVHPSAEIVVAGEPGHRYAWMPGADAMIPDADIRPDWDAVVVLDGDRFRLGRGVAAAFAAARLRGIVDHHVSTTTDGYDVVWLDAKATSTCAMIHEARTAWGVPLDRDAATQLYVGTLFDTGGFRHTNTTADTHRFAAVLLEQGIDHAAASTKVLYERRLPGLRATGRVLSEAAVLVDGQVAIGLVPRALFDELGLTTADLEGIVDALGLVEGVEVAALLIDRDPGRIKLSFRSRGRVDVAALAQRLTPTGGGHRKAAGATIVGGLDDVRQRVLDELRRALAVAAAG